MCFHGRYGYFVGQTVAWGGESAVYRITGVLSVIGGWFITAGAAFTICFIVALLIYWGGIPALVAMIGLAIYSLVRSHFAYKAKLRKEALEGGGEFYGDLNFVRLPDDP